MASPKTPTLVSVFLQQSNELRKHRTPNRRIVIDGYNLNIPAIVAAARYGAPIELKDDKKTRERVQKSVDTVIDKLASGKSLYGISSGFGGSADSRTSEHEALSMALLQMQNCGVLDDTPLADDEPAPIHHQLASTSMPEAWVRAAAVIRINSLIRGHSAVRWKLLDTITKVINADLVPLVPLRGSISASGDLSPLSYIAGAITATPGIKVFDGPKQDRQLHLASDALKRHNIEPLDFYPKEELGMLNGTSFSAALASLTLHDTVHITLLSQVLTAMAHEALLGNITSHSEFIHEVCRPHPGQVEVARTLEWLLHGSKLALSEDKERNIEEDKGELRQDRYSLRTAPQFLGPGVEELLRAVETVNLECNTTTDNPLIDGESGTVYHGGNFQASSMSMVMEKTRLSLAHIGKIMFAQFAELLNPALNRGLPPSGASTDPSLNYFAKGLDIAAAAYVAELGYFANPVTTHMVAAEMMNQSVNSLALISARMTGASVDVLTMMMASYLLCLCQCLDIRALQDAFAEAFTAEIPRALDRHFEPFKVATATAADISRQLAKVMLGRFDKNTGMDLADRVRDAVRGSSMTLFELFATQDVTSNLSKGEHEAGYMNAMKAFIIDLEKQSERIYFGLRDDFLTEKRGKAPASHLLGNTRPIYEYVRLGLNIPMHGLANLRKFEGPEGLGKNTTGQDVSKIYVAIRRGHMQNVLVELFEKFDGMRVYGPAKARL